MNCNSELCYPMAKKITIFICFVSALETTQKSVSLYPIFAVRDNLLSLSNTTTREVSVTSSRYIMSHENFNFGVDIPALALGQPPDSASYYGGTTYQLLMQLPIATTQVMIHFIHFNIGTKSIMQCERVNTLADSSVDKLTIHNRDVELYGCAGGRSPTDNKTFNITSSKDTLLFEFRTNSAAAGQLTGFSGFLLQYESKIRLIITAIYCPHILVY